MRLPIALALGWPERVPGAARPVDWTRAQEWTFEPLDTDAFPAVALAVRAGRAGRLAPAVYNAANEELVEAFHAGRITFVQIVDTLTAVVDQWLRDQDAGSVNPGTVEDVERVEEWARAQARTLTTD
jgi:1-deoxy-D-xylulose-5-phosphate reductoisomerase